MKDSSHKLVLKYERVSVSVSVSWSVNICFKNANTIPIAKNKHLIGAIHREQNTTGIMYREVSKGRCDVRPTLEFEVPN